MKFWTNEVEFEHQWHTVVAAQLQKYPNPYNGNVCGIDVLNQRIRDDGVLQIERIIKTRFTEQPSWTTKMLGISNQVQYSLEYSEIDLQKREMKLITRNLTYPSLVRVDERLAYRPDPKNHNRTVLEQGTSVAVNLPALADYCEKNFLSVYTKHAQKGPKGLEWVIAQLGQSLNNSSQSQ